MSALPLSTAKIPAVFQTGLQQASAKQTAQATSKLPIIIGAGVVLLLLVAMSKKKR